MRQTNPSEKTLAKHHPLYRWDALDGTWTRTHPNDIRPAMVLLAPSRVGSYDPLLGWHKESRKQVEPVAKAAEDLMPEEATDDDARSMGAWQSLDDHTAEVRACLDEIQASLPEVDHVAGPVLRQAARLHDWGKSHCCFQEMLLSAATPEERTRYAGTLLAKSPRRGWPNERRHFRHELASALALLACSNVIVAALTPVQRDLVAYLMASHHGKVRLGLRSLPREIVPPEGVRFALGIWEGDRLPEVPLTDGVLPSTVLSLESMEMGCGPDGTPSWIERTLALRDDPEWGPFRLALLEAILRAADVRASMGLAPTRTSERKRAQ
jgi:CRISPR-associated endonuclease/helicase Cas3